MTRVRLDPSVLADPGWWHAAVTVPLLAAHLAGVPLALTAAVGLAVVVAAYAHLTLGGLRSVAVQTRVAYVGLLVVGAVPGMGWSHAVQLAATATGVVVGYCPLGRLLGLLWFNRVGPLDRDRLARHVFARPRGGLVSWRPAVAPYRPALVRTTSPWTPCPAA